MSLRVDQDHSRFKQIIRGRIRKNLRQYISKGELLGKQGKDTVSIPIPRIDIPRFRFSDKQEGGVAQGDRVIDGQRVAEASVANRQAQRRLRDRVIGGEVRGEDDGVGPPREHGHAAIGPRRPHRGRRRTGETPDQSEAGIARPLPGRPR